MEVESFVHILKTSNKNDFIFELKIILKSLHIHITKFL